MKRFGMIIAGLALGMTTTLAGADQYHDGVMSAIKQNYREAYEALGPLAENGDPRALFNLGLMYNAGLHVELDEAKAIELYHRAAEQGVREAQQYLAAGYREGWFGLPMDYQKYRYWLEQSSE